MKKKLWITGLILALLAVCGGVLMLGVNGYVVLSTKNQILLSSEAAELPDVDCILVLGCRVYEDGTPSHMLEDRLRRSVELYRAGAAPKLLMSGDHGQREYDEVGAMKQYALAEGVSSQDVFMDHAGFSTYESIIRARDIFQADKIIIVTQQYHLYRALYIAEALGVEAYGVSSDYHIYVGQYMREIREILARVKDVGSCIFQPAPTYGGDVIPISGDGNLTNDENSDFT